ncbi:dTDP-4-dehydrorhamnose 3,5-epimerase [Pontimonas sp.]|nr:dTDP-4-dehydrorhamnose 3,5-epimerase [Pontimonas sp.]
MDIRALSIPGSFVVAPKIHADSRGEFVESFRRDILRDATGLDFAVAQTNVSVSSRGTLRGIHYADVPPGQAKYVMCASGSIEDFVVDLREGSPTFGQWDSVVISPQERNAVVLDVGLGHAFLALEDETTVTYLVTDHYKPHAEHAIDPLDPAIGLAFAIGADELLLSDKDRVAPTLSQAQELNALPKWGG